ncbi:MAG: hypothetical protein AB7I37_26195 [Pirellulales bacterium]
MIEIPDRLTPLKQRLEAGEDVTQDDLRRLAVLQALDVASMNEQFVKDSLAREVEHNELLNQI